MSGHRTIAIKPSRWQWNRFKDLVHFYTMLGVIPSALVILYVNLFIGPAKLAEIPEGYVPESHEFHSVSDLHFELTHLVLYQNIYIAPNHTLAG